MFKKVFGCFFASNKKLMKNKQQTTMAARIFTFVLLLACYAIASASAARSENAIADLAIWNKYR